MSHSDNSATQVRQAIESLIQAGTTFDVDQLDRIYHPSLQVVMTNAEGETNIADKQAFKSLFQSKREAGEAPLNTWAAFDHIEADGDTAHVLIRRRVKLLDDEQDITLSIDLIHENARWQVTREVIFTHPPA
ncbi:hypothetical protein [Erythrobacter sp. F6033]|uniref:nuclear transport factor 2 family protein n=1 Tax=Erythrobacter sp. F6033 TaxID=2926401 RepID=UPI001FF32EFF|nr:hypothetical protein [Erythrobacter sp. F6033]MCK0128861.1 hypothetical protein [Erythrobacter sp. F6033]